ncbi:MAG: HAD-IA family hydrolase [Planctomycetes bacterium]|nr:HAD-IA family hydrolase [Planctomycetota bacterium]MCB9910567.1 HAD-IA family hydrolase [Planctomycetota bacterium]MCB9913218.1 HAD-IA family hydrolase [Planctomycetota bacterium]HPF14402.1 HAD-IA family hydrolase [Planctomycetota bacterium]HRV80500.1 HAD-IA family hydrolase [Planctomycetota bacterium]
MPALDAILFDVDDTLFSTTAFTTLARRNAVHAMVEYGLEATEEQALAELKEVLSEFGSNYDHHFDKLVIRLMGRSKLIDRRAMIVSAGVVAYHDTKFQGLAPFEDVHPLLDGLVATDTRVGVITHGWTGKQTEKLIRLGLIPTPFSPDTVFISDAVGINKPNPKLYQLALTDMGLTDRTRVMYVGDNPDNDIAPPKSLGMKTVWCKRASKVTETQVVPDHAVNNFRELADILRDVYEIPLPTLID